MSTQTRMIEVPWDTYERLVDTVCDAHPYYTDMPTANAGHMNIIVWSGPSGNGIPLVITPQREDQDDEDQGRTGTAEVAAGDADAPRRRSVAITAHPA